MISTDQWERMMRSCDDDCLCHQYGLLSDMRARDALLASMRARLARLVQIIRSHGLMSNPKLAEAVREATSLIEGGDDERS